MQIYSSRLRDSGLQGIGVLKLRRFGGLQFPLEEPIIPQNVSLLFSNALSPICVFLGTPLHRSYDLPLTADY